LEKTSAYFSRVCGAYQLAVSGLDLEPNEIVFVSANG
jgi:hypothetical protein